MTKRWFQSKTIFINAIALGVALFQHYVFPIPAVDPQWYAFSVAAINLGLRFTTSVPVTR